MTRTCPRCSLTLPEPARFCSRCGSAQPGAHPGPGALPVLKIVLAVFLASGSLILGAVGSCFALFAFSESDPGLKILTLGLLLAAFAGLAGTVWLLVSASRGGR